MSNSTVDALAGVEVLDPSGAPMRLGDLWARRPVLLAMIRHFG